MQEPRQFNSIVIPIQGFTASGGNRVLSKLADHWIDMGLSVDFLVEDDSTPYFPTKARVLRCTTGKRAPKSYSEPMHKIGIIASIINLAKSLRKTGSGYDLVIASHSFTAIACYLSGCGAKTVYYIQAYDPEILQKKRKLSSRLAGGIARLSYLLCRNQIVNSSHYLEYKLINSCHVIPPGVDLNTFKAKANPGEVHSEVIKVGIIGRRELYKVRPVLEAYRSLRAVTINTKLIIAFGNIELDKLTGLGDYEVVRPKNDAELAAFYRDCDIFLALSEFAEGAFYPVLETLASGTVLVSNGFYKVTNENSWIVDKPENSYRIFKLMLEDTQLRVNKAKHGIQDVQELGWNVVAPLFLDYAKQVLRD